MRMLFTATFSHEAFNAEARKGTVGQTISRILEETRPETVFFTEGEGGRRQVMMLVDVADPSRVPIVAEPWFLKFKADCRFRVIMSPEELKKAALDDLGKEWA